MQIRWLRGALRNLEQAYDYIAQHEPATAARILLKIQQGANQLTDFPEMGRKGRVEGTRELAIVSTPYIVIYRIKGNTVEILRVLHGARKYPNA